MLAYTFDKRYDNRRNSNEGVIGIRIISICPSNTELAAYLNLTTELVGIDDYSDWPDSIQHLPRLGPDLSINMDLVEELSPDLVLASLSVPGMEKNVEELEKRGIPHVVYQPNTLQEIADNLLDLGKRTGKVEEAKAYVAKYKATLDAYQQFTSTIKKRKKLYWEWWPKPVFTPGKFNWLTEISRLAGGINIFEDVELASVQTSWEDVLTRQPDEICLAWVGVRTTKVKPEAVHKRPGWPSLEAVKENKIHVLEEALFCRPSPRLLEGLEKLTCLLWGDAPKGFKR